MIVAGPEGFVKGQYRKWNIKTAQTNDDFAMMREVFQRRFARAQDEDPDRDGGMWPDLVLIDGGKGQMSAARDTLEELGIEDVPLIAIAKGPHHGREGREVFHFPDGREKMLPVNSPRCCSTSSACATKSTASPSARTATSAAARSAASARWMKFRASARPASARCCCTSARPAGCAAALEDLQRAPGVSVTVAQSVYDFYHPGG
jgi:excinuclease ABC subunit C